MNEQPDPEQPVEAKPLDPPSPDPRRRLRELLAIPERDRTDEVWDEIASLEIELAPGNRAASPQADPGRSQEPVRRQEQGRRGGTSPQPAQSRASASFRDPGAARDRRTRDENQTATGASADHPVRRPASAFT